MSLSADPIANPIATPPAPAPEPAPATPPAADPAAPAPWEGKTAEELWATNEKLIKENVGYKDRFRPYEEAFTALHENDAKFFLGFAQALAGDNPDAIKEYATAMRETLDTLSPAEQKKALDALEQAAETAPIDEDRISKMLEDRLSKHDADVQQKAAVADWTRKLQSRSEELAVKFGIDDFKDAQSELGSLLYIKANRITDESDPMARLDKAAQAISDMLRVRGQELLKAKAADAGPSPVPADAAEPSGTKKPASLKDARRAADERLRKIVAEAVGT